MTTRTLRLLAVLLVTSAPARAVEVLQQKGRAIPPGYVLSTPTPPVGRAARNRMIVVEAGKSQTITLRKATALKIMPLEPPPADAAARVLTSAGQDVTVTAKVATGDPEVVKTFHLSAGNYTVSAGGVRYAVMVPLDYVIEASVDALSYLPGQSPVIRARVLAPDGTSVKPDRMRAKTKGPVQHADFDLSSTADGWYRATLKPIRTSARQPTVARGRLSEEVEVIIDAQVGDQRLQGATEYRPLSHHVELVSVGDAVHNPDGSLTVPVNVILHANGQYDLVANLVTGTGERIASAQTWFKVSGGLHQDTPDVIPLTFTAADIQRAAGQPLSLRGLALNEEGGIIAGGPREDLLADSAETLAGPVIVP